MTDEELRSLLNQFGQCTPQSVTDWSGDIPLSDELTEFYSSIGPNILRIPVVTEDLKIPSLADLWDFQTGYRSHPTTAAPLDDWPREWIVVADGSSDPRPFVLTRGSVCFAESDGENWRLVPAFANLRTMAWCIAKVGAIADRSAEQMDDDGQVLSELVADCQAALATSTNEATSEALLKYLGWIEA